MLPNQVNELVEFIWYAPAFNIILAGALLWVALTLALSPIIEGFLAGKLNARGKQIIAAGAAVLILLLYTLAIIQKKVTISETRVGIADYMMQAGLRDISFDQIRQTINSDYSNNLLLAVGEKDEKGLLRLSIVNSLSIKLLDSSRLNKMQQDEQVLANKLTAAAQKLAQRYPQAIATNTSGTRIGLTFREVDEVIFPDCKQLLILATLRDYPERFALRPISLKLPLDSIYVSLQQPMIQQPLWSRKHELIR